MGIIELGAIGELVGGVAVIASLVFIGAQVRQNNRLVSNSVDESYKRTFAPIFRQPGGLESWRRQRAEFTGRFRDYVERSTLSPSALEE